MKSQDSIYVKIHKLLYQCSGRGSVSSQKIDQNELNNCDKKKRFKTNKAHTHVHLLKYKHNSHLSLSLSLSLSLYACW